jgi:hypothetical protein
MKAAGLKAIDTVVSSTAILVKSKHPSNPGMVDLIASRIRGVISKPCYCHVQLILLLTSNSCPKIRSLPIQCPTRKVTGCNQNYTRQTSANDQRLGRRRMGRSQFYGREEENSNSHG